VAEARAEAAGATAVLQGAGGAEGSINSGNGNKLTALPLFAYKVRGGMTLDFTLYHNSETAYNDELGYGWTWSYDIYVNDAGSTATVHWGNGLSIPYTLSGGVYSAPAGIFDSLVKNGNGTWTLTKKNGGVLSFNAAGFCTSLADRNGNTITLTLNSSNYCTAITDPSGRVTDITLDGNNNFTSVEDPNGNVWSFTINGSDNLSTVTWPVLNGNTYTDSFAYSSHRITSHTDRRGKVWSATYNSDGSVATETNPLNKTTSYDYIAGTTTITDPLAHEVEHNYSSGKLTSVVDKSGYSVSYTSRNANNQVTALTDKRGKNWAYTYDARGNVLTVTDPLSHVTTYTWSAANDLLTVTDSLSHVTTYTYDSNGNRLTTTNALSDQIAQFTYDSYGQPSRSKMPWARRGLSRTIATAI
jgi:YD repeat-containing protein